jgi:hypothetical protein
VEQADLLDLPDSATAWMERSRSHHGQDELGGLADAADRVVIEAPAERQYLDTGVARVAVDERGRGQRHAHLRAVFDHHGAPTLEPLLVSPGGHLGRPLQPLRQRGRHVVGQRLVVVDQVTEDATNRSDLLRTRQLVDEPIRARITDLPHCGRQSPRVAHA